MASFGSHEVGDHDLYGIRIDLFRRLRVTMNAPTVTLLTIEEFAKLMRISRSTAYAWLAAGRLETGHHVLRIGGVVRIVWSDELFEHLIRQSSVEVTASSTLVRKGKGGRNICALDAEYLQVN